MSKARTRALVVVALLTASSTTLNAWADFSAGGRKQKGRAAHAVPGRARPAAPKSDSKAAPETKANAKDTAAANGALIARYTAIALSQPGVEFPIERLAQLFRERDGKLDALIEDFEQRASIAGSEQWNARIALAGIYKQAGKLDRAIATLQTARSERPQDPAAHTALAQLYADRGNKSQAREEYEAALPLIKNPTDSEQLLRTLLGLCLDLQDFKAAERYHRELVKRAGGSFFARAELGRELLARGHYPEAETQYRELVRAAAGDNRALGPALRDLAQTLAKQKKWEEALSVLRRALTITGEQSGLRREIFDLTAEIYRAEDRLTELIGLLEKEHPTDFERLKLLAGLYEETGQIEKALTSYRAALGRQNRDVSTHLKVIQLLQAQGEIAKAVSEYERLIAAAPHNADFVFQLAEALLQQGNREKALNYLRRLEAGSTDNPDALAALIDFYERIAEPDKALALLERLSQNGSDPERLIDLGNRYFEAGDKDRAERTWRRVLEIGKDRARAYQRLGDVYLEHDMADSALAALKSALELAPEQPAYKKAYALALERSGAAQAGSVRSNQYAEAERIWQGILQQMGANEPLAREARQHIVTLWSLAGEIRRHLKPLERRLELSPSDLEAGRLLAEAHLRLRNYAEAERALRSVVTQAPGDAYGWLGLERVLVAQHKLEAAIGVLEKLIEIEPMRAREYTQRMAGYAAELYQDQRALELATRVVELSPDDADGHRRLAEMYRRRQEPDKAISEFRKALAKNDRLFPVYFELAELLLNQNDAEQADKLLRRVMRGASDEESVARAARLSMQINLGRGDLEPLEKELLPLALGNPSRPVYRRLLVELYRSLTLPLLQRAKSTDPQEQGSALAELTRIGKRAVKPLLDALSDEQDTEQQSAIELLSKLPNRSAAPALFAYAIGTADPESRAQAMMAAGNLDDPALIPKLEDLVLSNGSANVDENDPVGMAAVWALCHLRDPKAAHALLELTRSESQSVRALAALGLGFSGAQGSVDRLLELALRSDESEIGRATAAFALAELGGKASGAKLSPLMDLADPRLRSLVLIAMARLGAPTAAEKISEALISRDNTSAEAARTAALILFTGKYRTPGNPFTLSSGRVDVQPLLEQLSSFAYSADEEAQTFVSLEKPLTLAVAAAVHSSEERALGVIDALLARAGKPAFGVLTSKLDDASPEAKQHALQAAERIAASVVAPLSELLSHPSATVRSSAVRFLGTREEPLARKSLLEALNDPEPEVRQAVLACAPYWNDDAGALAILARVPLETTWPMRARVLTALGELSRLDSGSEAHTRIVQALTASARQDDTALVRQAALLALHKLDREAARAVLNEVARSDDEAKLRATARALLSLDLSPPRSP